MGILKGRLVLRTSTPRFARSAAAVLLLLAVGACDDLGPSGPRGPGAIHVDLVSPNGAEGSAVFEITGGAGFWAVTAHGAEVYYDLGLDATRVVVIMDTPGPIRFQLRTENLRKLPSVTVLQVADGNDQLRSSLSGYEVELLQVEDGGAQ